MTLLFILLMSASAPDSGDSTFQYIECLKGEATRIRTAKLTAEAIADQAVSNCEEFVGGVAQESLDDMPLELVQAYLEAGFTKEQLFDRQRQIARSSARGMVLDMVEIESQDTSI